MKTSSSQFDMMVTFMEQHGDISKPSSNARGRLNTLKNWEELAQLLNSDGSGDIKTVEKWKKVWSDYKNNTKKKAARLHRAASGTGGGPATHIKLTDIEQRVLNLIGMQVATGLAVEEAGLPQMMHIQPSAIINPEQGSIPSPHEFVEVPQEGSEPAPAETNIAPPLPPPLTRALSSPPLMFVEEEVQSTQLWNEPGPSTSHVASQSPPRTHPLPSYVEVRLEDDTGMLSPTRPSSRVRVVRPEPAQSGQTTPRHDARSRRRRGSPRRRPHTQQAEAAQQFLLAEEFWRNFKRQQHRDYMDMRREQNRIREMEIQSQREWQALGSRALDILNKLVDKYC